MDTITIELSLGTSFWYVSGTYASHKYTSHLDMWLHLIDWRNIVHGPWMLIGDFNYIIHSSEWKGGNFNHSGAITLLNVIDKCNLVKVDMTDGKFIWNRPCTNNRMVHYKLDKALVDFALRMSFLDVYVEVCVNFILITISFSLGVAFPSKITGRVLLGLR